MAASEHNDERMTVVFRRAPPHSDKVNQQEQQQRYCTNAFLEFVALTRATLEAHTETCREILQNYVRSVRGMPISGARLRENFGSGGFVGQSPLETKRFDAPEGDPVVVVADCTRVMLESKILAMANAMAGELLESGQNQRWAAPTVRWTTGVPGCGKTKWVLEQMQGADSLAVTTTTEAAEDMRERLRITHNRRRVRTMASLLVNGLREGEKFTKLLVDEALMSHFGAIVMVALITKAHNIHIIGDDKQPIPVALQQTNHGNGHQRQGTPMHAQKPPGRGICAEEHLQRVVLLLVRVLFSLPHITEFEQACAVLTAIGNRSTPNTPPGKISIDAMTVGYTKGETKDMEGIILASQTPRTGGIRGQRTRPGPNTRYSSDLGKGTTYNSSQSNQQFRKVAEETNIDTYSPTPTHREITRQKSEPPDTHKGTASIPKLLPATEPRVHSMNALMEFAALTKATLRTHEETCKNILRNYRRGTWGMPTSSAVLRDLLRKAEAAVYDNERGIVLMGTMLGSYMAAYSDTRGFVAARSDGAEEGMYDTAPDDPVVVVAKCTRVMLEGRILAMAETVAGGLLRGENPTSWTETTFTWINGVAGCGKTQVIISNINTDRDMVITTTTEAAEDLRAKLGA
ncbi:hypothetical protein ACJJTC_014815 [Scirpophaga incertulas]